MKLTRTGGDRM